ncbi:MAG: universal stress protein UspA [Proteobacteria bacterium SG_bin5]|nr:universal stress protein [Sphingomonas sp.]OQW43188.1 MAG: universal stress protein UspA [Proteobacteria bacterium SG_bin5]
MRNILLLVHDDAGQEARLQVALDLARAFDAHLNCLDVSMVPLMVGDYAALGGQAMLLAEERAAEAANASRLKARLAQEGVRFGWQEAAGDPALCLKEASRLNDIAILNRALDTAFYPNMADLAGAVLSDGLLPVLAVPENARGLKVDGKALIAWDGSREAESALKAALPLLSRASGVTLLHIGEAMIAVPPEQAALYLSRRGIHVEVRHEAADARRLGVQLIAEAAAQCDYLVMGGFGHPRWFENLFGGTTATALSSSPVPVLLARPR